jgi:hypothetical protein
MDTALAETLKHNNASVYEGLGLLTLSQYLISSQFFFFINFKVCVYDGARSFLDNRLIGGDVVNLTRWPPFTRRKIPGTHFC